MFCLTFKFVLLWQCCRISTTFAQKCYVPNGTEIAADTPCGPTSSNQASACCNPEDTCLSNRLCLNSLLLTNRGTCTDPTWQSDGCAPWCKDGKTKYLLSDKTRCRSFHSHIHTVLPSSGIRIVNVKDELFCCGGDVTGLTYYNSLTSTCNNGTEGSDAPFPVDNGYVIFNRTSGSTSPNRTAAIIGSGAQAGTTIDPVAGTTAIVIAAGTAASSRSTTATVITTETAASSLSTSKEGATAGTAVGVPLGTALLGVTGLLWKQKRQTNRLRKERKDWEERYVALLESSMKTLRTECAPYELRETPLRHELHGATIAELQS